MKENRQSIGQVDDVIKPDYTSGGISLYHGECLDVMSKLAGPFDAIIADLPYG